ncbi:MAG: sulfite exporter TauE/SafE family protein [Woeseiaceae bacterium]
MTYTALAFLAVAFLYASVGFGGGSTYTAILIESGMAYEFVPPLSLLCNIVVVTGGVYHFARAGHLRLDFALPLAVTSVPAAFLGGYIRIEESSFLATLGVALFVAGILMVLDRRWGSETGAGSRLGMPARLALGAGLGALAGITGIGGGIYLAPALHLMRLADARTVAATCSFFILANSIAGLGGQLAKLGVHAGVLLNTSYLVLPLAVLVGGQLGSRLGATWLPAKPIRRLTGLVILLVSVRLMWRAF